MSIFESFYTTGKGNKLWKLIPIDDKIIPICRWDINPSFLGEVLEILSSHEDKYSFETTPGSADIIYPGLNDISKSGLSTRDLIKLVSTIRANKSLKGKATALFSIISASGSNVNFSDYNSEKHSNKYLKQVKSIQNKFLIPSVGLDEINKKLKKLLVPTVLRDGVLRMISIYNNYISDTKHFSHFVELKSFFDYWISELIVGVKTRV